MRVLVVTQYFWPENFRINDLTAELVRRGHEVTVLTGLPNYPDGNIFPEFTAAPYTFSQFEGCEVVRVSMTARGKGYFRLILNYVSFVVSASTVGLWKLRGRQFDCVFAYQPSPVTVGLPAALMRKVKRAPLVFWVQDLWPETLRALGVIRNKFVLQLIGKLVTLIYKRCDLILAQSKSFIPEIKRYAPFGRRIVYFPNWADADRNMQSCEPAPEVPVKPGVFNIMFAGNIGEAQDFPAVLSAAEHLREYPYIRWLIIGDGRMGQWLANEVKLRGLIDQFIMLGRYPSSRMPSFYRHADALLVSLKNDPIFAMTIPSKLQSYLAAGHPVVAMLNGEGSDIVRAAEAGITCSAGDHEGLAAAILKLSQMKKSERETMGSNGLALTAREFDRNKAVCRLEAWMKELHSGTGSTLASE